LGWNPVFLLSSRIDEQFLQRRWTPAQKPCRGDGYGSLSAGQKLSGMVFMVRTIGYGAHGQKVHLGNSPFSLLLQTPFVFAKIHQDFTLILWSSR